MTDETKSERHCRAGWVIYFAAALSAGAYITKLNGHPSLIEAWPELLGAAISIQLLPALICAIALVISKMANRSWKARPSGVTIMVIFYVGAAFQTCLTILGHSPSEPRTNAPVFSVVSPEWAECYAVFPGKPTESDVETRWAKGKRYEFVEDRSESLLRVEFSRYLEVHAEPVLKEVLFNDLKDLASKNGFERIQLGWDVVDSMPVASLSGFKTLTINGTPTPFRYEVSHFVGKRSIMSVTTGCPSARYPSPSIALFRRQCSKKKE